MRGVSQAKSDAAVAKYEQTYLTYAGHKDFFDEQARMVIDFCEERTMQYHIKDGTMREAVV